MQTKSLVPSLHVFEFEGNRLAYFVSTADLLRIGSEASAEALTLIEAGETADFARQRVRRDYPEAEADAACSDLDVLESAGMLGSTESRAVEVLSSDIAGYMRHKPRNVMFFVTEACNLACTYCYEKNQGVHDRPKPMGRVDARKILDGVFDAADTRDCTITFFGGEPLLNFPIVREATLYAEELARQRGRRVDFTMTTNLTLLTDEIAAFLADHRFHVMVSLDGNRENNDRYRVFRDGSGSYDVVVQNLAKLSARLRDAGVRLPKIRATMTAENFDAVAIEQHLRTLGTPLVEIGITHGTVPGGKTDYDVGAASSHRNTLKDMHLREVRRILTVLGRDPEANPEMPSAMVKALRKVHEEIARKQAHTTARPKLCGVCRNMRAVTPSGDLYPCHRYVGMSAFKMGNVHEGGFDADRVRHYYQDVYTAFEAGCGQCWARHLCGGQCPWYLSDDDGKVHAPDDETCDGIRGGYEGHLGLYAVLLQSHPAYFAKVIGSSAVDVMGAVPSRAPDDSCRC